MTKPPLKLACSACAFTTTDAAAFADHMVQQPDHFGTFALGPESGDLKELGELLATLQAHVTTGAALPEGTTVRPVSEQDILDDEELSDDDKALIIRRVRAIDDQDPD